MTTDVKMTPVDFPQPRYKERPASVERRQKIESCLENLKEHPGQWWKIDLTSQTLYQWRKTHDEFAHVEIKTAPDEESGKRVAYVRWPVDG